MSKVEFFSGSTLLATDTTSPYGATWSNVPEGTYTITARATAVKAGSQNQTAVSAAATITVNAPPVVSLTAPQWFSNFFATFETPANVPIAASASDSDGIASVTFTASDFLDGITVTQTITTSPYSTVLQLPLGGACSLGGCSFQLQAQAIDNAGRLTFSQTREITVAPDCRPLVSVTSPTSGSAYPPSSNISLTANVTSAIQSSYCPAVTVQYFASGSLLGTSSTSPPYNVAWNSVPAGNYSVTAVATNGVDTGTSGPVSITVGSSGQLFFIHTDHLNTPRLITDANQQARWRWDQQESFGVNTPDENPAGQGAFEFPGRFPGQYADKETNLFYNYLRDYDASLGRYSSSDPIGLGGGVNTYAYARHKPLAVVDPTGLVAWTGTMTQISADLGGGASRMTFRLKSECVKGRQAIVDVLAGGFSVGFGAELGVDRKDVKFEDDNRDIDPFVFEGQALFTGVGLTIGGYDPDVQKYPWQKRGPTLSCEAIRLGGATSVGCGPAVGFEAGINGGAGISMVRGAKFQCCK